MVKSKEIYSLQSYLEAVTGKCYSYVSDCDIEAIQNILSENNIDAVLVECQVWDEHDREFKSVYRWFEVPAEFAIINDTIGGAL